MKTYYVYILLCADDSFYTGVTNNLERRLLEHNEGISEGSYTLSRRPVQLEHFEEFQFIDDAITREKQLKKWSRAKKKALIGSDIDALEKLSKKRFDNSCHSE